MRIDGKIAFLGAGNMGQALIRGLIEADRVAADQLVASDTRAEQRTACWERYGIHTSASNHDAARGAAVVVLAVKPQIIATVLEEVRETIEADALVISIAAGVTIASIEARLRPGTRVVRTMPNVCSLVREGATALSSGTHATDADLDVARRIFESVGLSVVVDEALMDAVTGLSGSGPAYIFMVIEALSDAGVKAGLSRGDAHALSCQTVLGAAKLAIETKEHPGRLKDMVCSPGGTAIAAVHELEKGGLRTTLINAVEVAAHRAAELGGRRR
ncbi:MAG: pyrroline-5-carboxylate reductase [Proteobacteria bacterium]|nr:pyrroline-5-carboxylate reductase [Pseudomonadota bacterium]